MDEGLFSWKGSENLFARSTEVVFALQLDQFNENERKTHMHRFLTKIDHTNAFS